LSLKLKDLLQEKNAIDFFLNHHVGNQADELLMHKEFQRLLSPFFHPLSKELDDWMNSPFDCNQAYPEKRIQKTISGHTVRSKSEALIDMALYINRIPFRYECALQLGNHTIYPDFTIRHPTTGETYYWEHFGQMDNPDYTRKTITKLARYINHEIIPGIHLITTYETGEHPLNSTTVERQIEEFFL